MARSRGSFRYEAVAEEWMKGRAAADKAMRRAGEERTASPPPIEAEDETDDIVSAIGWQHNQVKYRQEQLETIPGVRKGGDEAKQQQRASIVDMIRMRLSKHETAEEELFWPAVRRYLDDGDRLADEVLHQEQEGKDLLHAPTRPHPHAPSEGAPLKAASALAAPMDHLRDTAGKRPAKRAGQVESKKKNRTKKGTE